MHCSVSIFQCYTGQLRCNRLHRQAGLHLATGSARDYFRIARTLEYASKRAAAKVVVARVAGSGMGSEGTVKGAEIPYSEYRGKMNAGIELS